MMINYNIPYYPNRPDNAKINSDPTIIAKRAETIKNLHQDPTGPYADWKDGRPSMCRENITTEHLNTDSNIVKKKIENSKKWHNSDEGKEAYLRGRKKICKSIQDPDGKIWTSRKDAAAAWNIRPQAISKYVKTPNSGWNYL